MSRLNLFSIGLLLSFFAAISHAQQAPAPLPATPVNVINQPGVLPALPAANVTPPPVPVVPATNPNAASKTGGTSVQFPPGTPLNEVLEFYQQLTGNRLIRDPRAENVTVSIETTGF